MTAACDKNDFATIGSGEGTPALFLHAGSALLAKWIGFPWKLAMAPGRKVITMSNRHSCGPVSFNRTDALVGSIVTGSARTISQLGIGKVHHFGHGHIGTTALDFAARHPGRIVSLIKEARHQFGELFWGDSIAKFRQRALKDANRSSPALKTEAGSEWLDCPALLIPDADGETGSQELLVRKTKHLPQAHELRIADCRHGPHCDRQICELELVSVFLEEHAND